MANMFSSAYFGKPYITRDGHKSIYITCEDKDFNSHPHILIQEDTKKLHYHNDYGQVLVKYDPLEAGMYDIVSEWQKEIDEDDKLAEQYIEETPMTTIEERAKEYILHCSTAPANRLGRLQGYIKGATEQKQIDIEEAIKWIEDELFDNNEDFFYPVLESKHYSSVNELIAAFRKAMTKE